MYNPVGVCSRSREPGPTTGGPARAFAQRSYQEWQQYADRLFALLRGQRDLGREWKFSDKDLYNLGNYFYGNDLLVQCLKVAAVTDRQAVLNNLLLPPAIEQQRIRDNNGLVV